MSSEVSSARIDQFRAPFGKEITVEEVVYDNGFRMLRLRIREARRFTVIDLDPVTARHWGALLGSWAEQQVELGDGADADGE
ncbi:MAG TPA: hypothetical protein VIW02_09170 [Gammaproteobacteria bacterium]